MSKKGQYSSIIASIFRNHYKKGTKSFEFKRTEIETEAAKLKIKLPKNLGDLLYSFRFRADLPEEIAKTAPKGYEWIIELCGQATYRFVLSKLNRIIPRADLLRIKIPDATPEIITRYALSDEQALLAKVRYNRLIDIFLGVTTYSLQSHLRTTVKGMGQIEIDEVYVGINKHGAQFIIPVQAKGGSDQLGAVQAKQDILCCADKFPDLICRPISAQFVEGGNQIVLFELTLEKEDIKVVEEKHYELVAATDITGEDLKQYRYIDPA